MNTSHERTERGERRRLQILEAYYDLLNDEGPAKASIGKLASRLNLPPSTIIYYFGTKENLLGELVTLLLDRYDQDVGGRLRGITDSYERLLAIIETYFTPVFQAVIDNAAYYACYALSFHDERLRSRFEIMYERGMQLLELTISECMVSGVIPQGDARRLARAVYSLEEGYFNLSAWDPFGHASVELCGDLRVVAMEVLGLKEDQGRPDQ